MNKVKEILGLIFGIEQGIGAAGIEQIKFSQALKIVDDKQNDNERFLQATTILYLAGSINAEEFDSVLSELHHSERMKKIIDSIEAEHQKYEEKKMEQVRFRKKSSFQKPECLFCGKEATLEAVCGIAAIRCCENKECKNRAAALAKSLQEIA
jgi:hypothetical protein